MFTFLIKKKKIKERAEFPLVLIFKGKDGKKN